MREKQANISTNYTDLEKKVAEAEHRQQALRSEIVRVIDGDSAFSRELLMREINEAQADVEKRRQELAEFTAADRETDTVRSIRKSCQVFLGWANDFEQATIPQKRTILRQLIDKIELGKGYQITIHFNKHYAQFVDGDMKIEVVPEKSRG